MLDSQGSGLVAGCCDCGNEHFGSSKSDMTSFLDKQESY
jgi:predicted  nucleic acid-binding Zn-ribbon protein